MYVINKGYILLTLLQMLGGTTERWYSHITVPDALNKLKVGSPLPQDSLSSLLLSRTLVGTMSGWTKPAFQFPSLFLFSYRSTNGFTTVGQDILALHAFSQSSLFNPVTRLESHSCVLSVPPLYGH